jgi:hypothetical protein
MYRLGDADLLRATAKEAVCVRAAAGAILQNLVEIDEDIPDTERG